MNIKEKLATISIITMAITGCSKNENLPTKPIPIIVTQNSVKLPPPAPVPTPSSQPSNSIQEENKTDNPHKVKKENMIQKPQFTPVLKQGETPTPPPALEKKKTDFNPNTIPDPTFQIDGNKTKVTYFGKTQIINGKFIQNQRTPDGFLVVTTTGKYFFDY